jgi:hypothetical protein
LLPVVPPAGSRRPTLLWWLLGMHIAAATLGMPGDSIALEAFDGRVQLHGFYESQLRALAKGYSANDGWDLAQWYQVLDLELELDVLEDDWGPFNSISGFVRADVRYDCVWSGGCGMFDSVNTYGNQAKRLPKRYSDGHRTGFTGVVRNFAVETDDDPATPPADFTDRRPYIQIPLGQGSANFSQAGEFARPVNGQRELARIWNVPGLGQLFFSTPSVDPLGHDSDGNPNSDPGRANNDLDLYAGSYIASDFLDYRFGVKQIDGVSGGDSTAILGPWRPIDRVFAYGVLADRPNPYAADRLDGEGILPSVVVTPIEYDPVTGIPVLTEGTPELAFRPATAKRFTSGFDIRESQGLYYPTTALRRFLDDGAQVYDQNFSQTDLAWNHGASQSDDRELREAYLDIEVLDSRLWGRFGKQVIVWGKTELFRAVDQFNPQDLGLSSLPSLEESRIPMWAARMILSLGDLGPAQDIRIEAAVLLDQYEPADLGRCGEPYSPILTCSISAGLLAHALTGTGLAGEVRPPDPWDDVEGLEGGIRIEWRAGRFSFSLSDYYGYDDFPYIDQLNVFERNVDPVSGRPRIAGARGACLDGTEFDCLGAPSIRVCDPSESDCDNNLRILQSLTDTPLNPLQRTDVLDNHSSNQQIFATICASTVGIEFLPSACGLTVWNSPTVASDVNGAPLFSSAFTSMLAGGVALGFLSDLVTGEAVFNAIGRFVGPFDAPLVGLHRRGENLTAADLFAVTNPGETLPEPEASRVLLGADGRSNGRLAYALVGVPFEDDLFRTTGFAPHLTDDQEALLGCGRFWGNPCDVTGFDLFNTEASMFFQSWAGIEGTDGADWDTWVGTQPGTLDFVDAVDPLVCSRAELGPGGRLVACRDTIESTAIVFEGMTHVVDPRELAESELEAYEDIGVVFKHPFFGPDRVCLDFGCPGVDNQFFSSELAALSFNALMTFAVTSSAPDVINNLTGRPIPEGVSDRDPYFNEFDHRQPYRQDGCSLRKPLLCRNVAALLSVTGTQSNAVRAGGNGRYGRRDFLWHSGAVVGLRRNKRNVLGFAFDFAEDRTKTAWAVELSWLANVEVSDFNERDGRRTVDQVNLVMSVDRSTFINFLNANRTFFINSQLFLRYIPQHRESMPLNGPVNALATLSIFTGYWQDRLNPALTVVRDFQSESGAVLSSITYRYSERFSTTFGMAWFYGKTEKRPYPLTPIGVANGGAGKGAYHSYVQNGLSVVKDRDEVFLRLRYTF